MSKKQRKLRQKIAKTLVSVFVLLTFIIPTFLMVKWVGSVLGSADPRKVTNVAAMQVRTADRTGQPIKPFSEPIITVSFDDGWESIYTAGLSILQKNGVRTTQYIITDTFDDYSYMSLPQLKSMQKAGHEIGSHTIGHSNLTMLDDNELTHELGDSQKTLEKEFGGQIRDFTSPYGAYNAHTLEMIGKYYRSQKNAEGDPAASELEAINVKDTFKPLNLTSYSVRQGTSLDDIKKLLKAAQDNNGWLVLTYHQIDYSGEEFSVPPEKFEQQMSFLGSSNVRSATVGQFMDAYLNASKPGAAQ